MKKKWLATSAAGLVASFVYLGIAMLTAPVMVDGVTAATTNNTVKFVTPFTLTSTTAVLKWTASHTDGNAVLTYNGASLTLTTAQRTAKTLTLTGLTPSTLYNIKLACTKSGETEADATGSFTTPGNTINQPPVMTSATSVSCTTNMTKTYTVTATDPNNDPITFAAGTLPNWITFSSPTLTLKPVTGSTSTTVTITASDGKGGTTPLNLAVTVVVPAPVSHPPVFTCPTAVSCTTGMTHTFTVSATDANGDPITYTPATLPGWVTFASPTLTMKPVAGSANATINLFAADGKGGLDTLNLAVTVRAPATSTLRSGLVSNQKNLVLTIGSLQYAVNVKDEKSIGVALYACNGARVFYRVISGSVNQVVLPDLPKGIYLLKAGSNKLVHAQKIIVK